MRKGCLRCVGFVGDVGLEGICERMEDERNDIERSGFGHDKGGEISWK